MCSGPPALPLLESGRSSFIQGRNHMTSALRRASAFLFTLFASTTLFAAELWEVPPFSLDPKELLAAGEKVQAGTSDVVMLLDEERYTFQADGTSRSDSHLIFRVVTESGVDDASSASAVWAPWY